MIKPPGRFGFRIARRSASVVASTLTKATRPSWERPHVVQGNVAFGVGQPSSDLLPTEMISSAATSLFDSYAKGVGDARESLQYADTRGTLNFREQLALFLGRDVAQGSRSVDPETLMITNGSSLGLNMCASTMLEPGDTVLCESHTYFLARKTLEDNGLNLIGIPCDEHGIIMDGLEDLISRTRAKGLYCIPTYHNPTSVTLPMERRRALVDIAQRTGLLLLCDDVYDALHWHDESPPPNPLVGIARDLHPGAIDDGESDMNSRASVISIGSFSKIAGPGLRLGWLESSRSDILMRILQGGWVDSGGGLNPMVGEIVRESMKTGHFQENVNRIKHMLRRRCDALCDAVRSELGWEFNQPTGGYFLWVKIPEYVNMSDMQAEADALPPGSGVSWMNAEAASISMAENVGSSHNRAIRLSFAHYNEAELVEGVRRIARLPAVACNA